MQKENNSVIRWNESDRRTAWTLITKVRTNLNLELSPVIATAHCVLQRYFRQTEECPYKLFILMIAALFTTCKANDTYRPMELIFTELNNVCSRCPSAQVRDMAMRTAFSEDILREISNAEIDLLTTSFFDINIDLPFSYIEKWKSELHKILPGDEFIKICNSVIVDVCLLICSQGFLDAPAEAGAAVAIQNMIERYGHYLASQSEETYNSLQEWLQSIKEKYDNRVFDWIYRLISNEKSKTVTRRS